MPDRVLDVGSGSGILGIAALALGAGTVDAVDTDPRGRAATAANAGVNGVRRSPVASARGPGRARRASRTRSVLANLVAAVLIELAPRLTAHLAPGGTLLASGIIDDTRRMRWRRRWRPPACRAPSAGSTASGSRCGCCARDPASVLRRAGRDAWRSLPTCRSRSSTRSAASCGCRTASDWCCSTAPARPPPFAWRAAAARSSRGEPAGGEPVHRLVIWQALLRGDHLEPVIRHGTEIGVAAFRLFVSERCVAREVSPRAPGASAGRGARGRGAIGARPGAARRRAGAASRRIGADIGPAVRARRLARGSAR